MSLDVLSALDLDKESLHDKFILIKEFKGSDGNFIVNCLISKQIKSQNGVVLVAVRNPLKHYQKIGLNMGYNLVNSKEYFQCIDCFDLIIDYCKDPSTTKIDLMSKKKSLKDLFDLVRDELDKMLLKRSSVCLVIDELLDFIELGFSVRDVNLFVQCCRGYAADKSNLSIAVGVHFIPADEESSVLAGLMSHMSDIICEVSALKTGRSHEITGSFSVSRPFTDFPKTTSNLVKLNKYHYKSFERGIKVFAPGSK